MTILFLRPFMYVLRLPFSDDMEFVDAYFLCDIAKKNSFWGFYIITLISNIKYICYLINYFVGGCTDIISRKEGSSATSQKTTDGRNPRS
jgi:hypothetical protein